MRRPTVLFASLALLPLAPAQTTPEKFFGHEVGADYTLINYQRFSEYWRLLDRESDRMVVQSIGKTEEGRDQLMAIVSSPKNLRNLKRYQEIARRMALAKDLTPEQARALAKEGKAVIWIDGGLHSTETLAALQLIETSYRMVSGRDDETNRILDNVIILFVHANPDGMDLVADWYMQEADRTRRNLNIPRLYQKYIGHDNNRDFFLASQRETQNMNRVMYREWFPQVVYNHHQTSPRGTVMFAPPFRDPFNYRLDPQVMTGLELVSAAMIHRFSEENKPGVTQRRGATFSAWWNGGLRTTSYFHNMIGILTETTGHPTPMRIAFVQERRLPSTNLFWPVEPQEWKMRWSVEYSVTANKAILDLASRRPQEFLFGIYQMGRRQIEMGRQDTWTDLPRRVATAESMADLRKPEYRNPRAFVIPPDDRHPVAIRRFLDALWLGGIEIHVAAEAFTHGGKTYPKGSFVFLADQAFRPHLLDMFEPQDHPDDIPAPGAAPTPPYDTAGYTLAKQMGFPFDRLMEPPQAKLTPWSPSADRAGSATSPIDLGVTDETYAPIFEILKATGRTEIRVGGETRTLTLPRIALWDRYGGSMDSGWTRWVFDQHGVPYTVVFPQELEAGNLNAKYDVLILPDNALGETLREPTPANPVPEPFRHMTGSLSTATVPALKSFVENGGTIVAWGTSSWIAKHLGLPVESALVENGRPLPRSRFFVPGSLLEAKVTSGSPYVAGMPERPTVMYDNHPVYRFGAGVETLLTFDTDAPLRSGWALGQGALKGGIIGGTAPLGKGRIVFYSPDIVNRAQSHGTFRLLFNAILLR